ncbi:hypothetical protein S7711_09902 [Stachybotrys chartarum IBT 7711]|uniref:O-methylsterigmatocystin oxidoreductase n=1 Tax=Stachybotrys chartarum (strain CBS 109288 / IBT 7711) TaxID=1280523 RepID=A0A084AEW0_STACB|nr:hypothetical protein S7711_09902 [Stachybotrys chartarum IBT 7711]KFA45415.1 hypothetical protein S40293_09942 [Stachybotrys chartarum IBT 40293]
MLTLLVKTDTLSFTSLAAVAGGCLLILILLPFLWTDRRLRKIPGPSLNPFVGLGIQLPPDVLPKFRQWADQHGEVFRVQVGWHHWVVLNSPEAMKAVFDKQSASTSSKLPMPMSDVVVGGRRMPTMAYGPKWRAYRQLCHRILTAKAVESFIPYQTVEISRLLYDLANHNSDEAAFYKHIHRMLFSTLMRAVYGRPTASADDEDIKYTEQSAKLLSKIQQPGYYIEDVIPPLASLPTWAQPSYKQAAKDAEWILWVKMRMWNRLKEQFAVDSAPPCYAKQMIESDFTEQGLDEADLAWIAGGLVDAGSATSTATFHNLILYLAACPEAQAAAARELDNVVGDSRAPAMADVPQLPYVWACIKEVLRRNPMPPWAIRHFTDADVVYKDMVIPRGTAVVCNTVALQYDKGKYPDPMAFQPERYLRHPKFSGEYAAMADPHARDHFTFGAGRRVCPGTRLAESNLAVMLANVIWAFEIQPPLGGEKKAISMDVSDDAFDMYPLRHAKPFKARFIPRNAARLEIVQRDGLVTNP